MKIRKFLERFEGIQNELIKVKKNSLLVFLGPIFFILIIYSAISYNSKLKEERLKTIASFLANNDTILLKNYLLNQIESPYLEYDYLIKDGDTIENIFKKPVKIMEVQMGPILKETDIIRYRDIYGRVN